MVHDLNGKLPGGAEEKTRGAGQKGRVRVSPVAPLEACGLGQERVQHVPKVFIQQVQVLLMGNRKERGCGKLFRAYRVSLNNEEA